jgi:predicted DNA-binding transcriptional regulator AlpA
MSRESPTTPTLALDVKEIAASVRISEGLVWKEIQTGDLETVMIGDRRLATPAQIEQWLQRKAERARQRREERAMLEETARREEAARTRVSGGA